MNIQVVGVVGAGVMGIGVSQNLAQTGYQVILVDISEAILERRRTGNQERISGFKLFSTKKKRLAVPTIS
jgi:3-hydroxybutyryl-CoA dehydrogenase